ncbi:hypothetical protein JTE90_024416 [Oedothorax gibbosus]|uniref:TRUD domain-containing protein n=1 Tax=Oedothorax gibbosus TaxID=931172 RepID=A0AAV6UFA4_9ARAC|nr:hypothetical protein JTE90_024416 [Oedothorax gibbosus]
MEVIKSSVKRPLDDQSLDNETISIKKFCSKEKQPNKNNSELCDSKDKLIKVSGPRKTPHVRASEHDVGITEYISDLPGFSAVIKERYSDFLVNEIDLQGKVVRLTDLEKPQNPERDYNVEGIVDDETVKKLEDLVSKKISEVRIDVTHMDKDSRKNIHVALRNTFPGIESNTEDIEDKKFVVVKNFNHNSRGRRFQPSVGGNYLHFVLYKENKDTMDTVNTIASFLKLKPKVFSYAGSKDKRGKTSQMVSAYKINPDKLLTINKQFNMIKVGNIVYKSEQLKLGDLLGNLFTVILRQLEGEPQIVEKAVKSLSTKGFINYYGMQRFGTSSVPTHIIGRHLLLGDYKESINLLLTPRPEDDEDLFAAKTVWVETNDANRALMKLKRKWSIEGKLLLGLTSANKNDFCNAFGAIPRNMRLMYIHSFQSYIWNKVVSKRIKLHGLKVLKGDLVPKEDNAVVDNIEDNEVEGNRKAVLSRMVKVLSAEEVDKYNIKEVLIALPGHSVVFPDNEMKDWYDEFLKEEGMVWSNFDSKNKSYSLSGDYRKLIVIPEDTKWQIIPYDDGTLPLVPSDLDVIQNQTIPPFEGSGSFKALKLEFKLPPSAYATMAIREVLKQSTCYLSKT